MVRNWIEMRRKNPALTSPYFHPQFTSIVARQCSNVEVAVIEERNKIAALLPFQRTSKRIGVPVGRPLSDYHGLISATDCALDARDLIRQCGLIAWDFDHLLASQNCFAAFHEVKARSPQIDLSGSFDEYVKARKEMKSLRAKMRRLTRDFGPLRTVLASADCAAMQQLLLWKSQQYRRTGQPDIFKHRWITGVVQAVHGHRDPDFCGMLSLLYAGDHLVAALLGIRSASVYHYWFPAYDFSMAHYSPGSVLLLMLVEQAKSVGIEMIDLGKNMSEQKRRFMNVIHSSSRGCRGIVLVASVAALFGQRSPLYCNPTTSSETCPRYAGTAALTDLNTRWRRTRPPSWLLNNFIHLARI
jgi:CelD/BcsL family acetyltransferase involved in cellulose biosynthesis